MSLRNYSEEFQFDYKWQSLGNLTATASISATDKSKAAVEALECVVDEVDPGTVAVNYRFLCDANAKAQIVDVYAMRGNDHYTRICTLALTGGQAVYGAAAVFCDTVVVSNEEWPTKIGAASPVNDDIASIAINTHGYSSILFLATTFGSTNALQIQKARI